MVIIVPDHFTKMQIIVLNSFCCKIANQSSSGSGSFVCTFFRTGSLPVFARWCTWYFCLKNWKITFLEYFICRVYIVYDHLDQFFCKFWLQAFWMIFCENCRLLVLILFLCASDYCSFTSYNYSRKFVIDFFILFLLQILEFVVLDIFFFANLQVTPNHFFCKIC